MASRPALLAVVGAVAVLSLSACVAPAAEPTASSPHRSVTPTATAATGPSASSTTAPAALIVSTAGLGPFKLGRPVPADTTLVTWNPDVCGAGVGTWSAPEGAGFSIGTRGKERAPIFAVQVSTPSILTPSGLHVGSTRAEVAAALPKAAYHEADVYGVRDVAWYSVVAGGNRITLSISSMDGTPVGDATPVAYIFVFPATQEDTHFIGTDGIGSCA